ncbi:MAG: hypothetical protein AVO33_09060 [delta proteobacterium ML8_F1]|nr:MAG: hypothetical protein AVO33_09060 [delta proteobacterium ML8_F1]
MPKATFFNLPDEKRERIIDLAVGEFERLPYDKASVNRIVRDSGIAKGSFYQYFEDKLDLYTYVIHLIVEEKLKYLSPLLGNSENEGFFKVIEALFKSGIQFAVEHPRYVNISKIFMADTASPIYAGVVKANLHKSHEIYRQLISQGIERGELRSDLDVDFLAHLMTDMNYSVVDYVKKIRGNILDESLVDFLRGFLSYLEKGIGNPQE